MENKEKKFDAYMRPETEEFELTIENICQNESLIDGGCELDCQTD